ncbi:oxidoreductase [Desarmillaria tabescens]|uniref:Oxidoreductase n=1 Tax=Armillaria tabescens TaxID=1929756 RepID=A0AA39JP02_ARMTA|nr:oxidoreductase [Desarmillaria tabescens]KAK0446054.1 oxidoreductase [Desarmillaria tabescens]
MTTPHVPVISLASCNVAGRKAEVVRQIGEACASSGFFQIVDHPIPQELIERAFETSVRFFALPAEEKLALARDPWTNRGYEILERQSLQGAVVGHDELGISLETRPENENPEMDLKEGFLIGDGKIGEDHPFFGRFAQGVNHWPNIAGMRDVMNEYLSTNLMELVALSLNLPEKYFAPFCKDPTAAIRLLHYLPQRADAIEPQIGASAHTDFGALTLLATSGTPGLELWSDGKWFPIEPAHGAYVVNVGDLLQMYTTGKYLSSLHRVINRSGNERYSIPFFLDGNLDAIVKSIYDTSDTVNAVSVESHLRTRFDGTYQQPMAAKMAQVA